MVLEFESDALDPDEPQDVEEVVNYVAAMNHGMERLKTLPVSLRLIREIHEQLMRNVRGGERNLGEFRRSQNWIGPPSGTLKSSTFVPPPPHELQTALGNFEMFLDKKDPMPVLIKVGLAQAQFEMIHPFPNGNGRVGRLLITFLLCEKDILKRPLLYLSHFFKQNQTEYYDRLQAVRDDGNWEGWLKYFLRGVFEVSQQATSTARQIANLREQHRQQLTEKLRGSAANGLTLLESLFWRPVISVHHASEVTGLCYPNANNLVSKFEELGLLHEITGQKRNRRFSYDPYLQLFTDAEPSHPSSELDVVKTEGAV